MTAAALSHELLLYSSLDQYVDTVASFAREGVREDDVVIVVVPEAVEAQVLEALEGVDGAVSVSRSEEAYARPQAAYAGYYATLERLTQRERRRVRAFAEPPFRSFTPTQTREMLRAEAAFNVFLGRFDARVICPYSADLPDDVIEAALLSHAVCVDGPAAGANPRFADAAAVASTLDAASPDPPATSRLSGGIPQLEDILWSLGVEHEFAIDEVHRLLAGGVEVLSNAAAAGAVVGSLACWADDDRLVCEIGGRGGPFEDPLVGYAPPDRDTGAGLDLWLARQLVDGFALRGGGEPALRLEVERAQR